MIPIQWSVTRVTIHPGRPDTYGISHTQVGKCRTCKSPSSFLTFKKNDNAMGSGKWICFSKKLSYLSNNCFCPPCIAALHSPLSEFIVKYCIIVSCIVHSLLPTRGTSVCVALCLVAWQITFFGFRQLRYPANTILQWQNCCMELVPIHHFCMHLER